MNGMFKNSRGLRDLAKHLHIAECISDHSLDFIAISETGVEGISQEVCSNAFLAGWTLLGSPDQRGVVLGAC